LVRSIEIIRCTVYRGDLGEMPQLTMCIKESLRRVPAVPTVSRELSAPLTVDGVTLRPGTIVQIGIFNLHHNPSVWGDDHMVSQIQRRSQRKPGSFIPN